MNTAKSYIEQNTEINISKVELSKLTCINFLFLSESDIMLIHEVHNTLVSYKVNSSVRSFFEKIIDDTERLGSFCERFNYDIDKIEDLIHDSLEYPTPNISRVQQNVKLVAQKILQQKEVNELIEKGLSHKAIKAIQFFFTGISITKILKVTKEYTNEEVNIASGKLGQRELREDRIHIVRNELYNQNYSFYTKIFMYSNEGKECKKLLQEEDNK
ncbi:hypothetical protein A9Q91_02530 [Candidatus Gracilibacteria bacterium 28_42_T64]|nr:hypothetical protein A9Q91_02530 [Candidatus Gracilibacteria bacterium 28_42_T64]